MLTLVRDCDELVRANACDSLGNFCSDDVVICLSDILLSKDSDMVRSYAAMSLGDIAKRRTLDSSPFRTILKGETSDSVKIAILALLFCSGDESVIKDILVYLDSENYQTRCFCINSLKNVVTEKNKDSIIESLSSLRKREKSIAVQSTINRMLEELCYLC